MAHEIETMAYTNEVPWHGLGTHIANAPSVDEMLKRAKLDWTINKHPIHYNDQDKIGHPNREVDDYFALVRDSDGSCLDVVGKQYRPVQNKEAFEFFNEFVQSGKAKMETAGSLRGGRFVWGLANLQASFRLEGNDEVKGYLLVASPHESGKALIIKFTTIRVVCNNTLTLALKGTGNEFRMAHRLEFNENMRTRAKEVLGIAREQMADFEIVAKSLKKLKMNDTKAIAVLSEIYDKDADLKELKNDFDGKASPSLKKVMDVLHHAPGADPTTGWGVLNAVTYYADHVASRSTDKRMLNAWMGKTATHKTKILDSLIQLTA